MAPFFTSKGGDIPAKRWRIHPRAKPVAFCCRGKENIYHETLNCQQSTSIGYCKLPRLLNLPPLADCTRIAEMRENLQKVPFSLPAHYDAAIEWEGKPACRQAGVRGVSIVMEQTTYLRDGC